MIVVTEATQELVSLLEAVQYPGDTPVVTYGIPREWEHFTVMVGSGEGSIEYGAIGNRRRAAEFTIEILLSYMVPGIDDQMDAHERAWAAWQAIDAAVLEHHATAREDSSEGVLFSRIATIRWQPVLVGTEGYGLEIAGAVEFNATT